MTGVAAVGAVGPWLEAAAGGTGGGEARRRIRSMTTASTTAQLSMATAARAGQRRVRD